MTETATDVPSGRSDAPAEPRTEPTTTITDADRAANPLGVARREREQNRHDHRGDAGKFAPKDDAKDRSEGERKSPQAAEKTGENPDKSGKGDHPPGYVPQQALHAARERERELQRQLAEFQQRPPAPPQPPQQQPALEAPPAWWEDPDKAMEHRMRGALDPLQQRLEQQLMAQRTHFSRSIAVSTHGKEAVDGALAALQSHLLANRGDMQRVEAQLSQSMDPVGDVVRWHKQQTTAREIGDDPAAYRERLRAELLAEMQQQGGGQQHDPPPAASRQPPVQPRLPTSFAAQPGGGARGGAGYGGPKSLSEMLPRG